MTCVICKEGHTRRGVTTVTLEGEGIMLVVKDVPAEVCDNCGEQYLDEQTGRRLLRDAEETAVEGVQLEVRSFRAA